jgi:hypothetical protein
MLLITTKHNIRQAINDQGVQIPNTEPFNTYPDYISQIEGEGPGVLPSEWEHLPDGTDVAAIEYIEPFKIVVNETTDLSLVVVPTPSDATPTVEVPIPGIEVSLRDILTMSENTITEANEGSMVDYAAGD